jgi:putative membrane-bound dehydrogenase-like protein
MRSLASRFVLPFLVTLSASAADDPPKPQSPDASLKSIRVRSGFRVELAASEPLVLDPIAFDWGADGKLWVVEMGDYPLGTDGKGAPGGAIKVLEDRDGDGRYDKATTFLEGLAFPTGAMPWRKGVLIACAPDILYAEDRDHDGKADHREVLFTGFGQGNQQHRLNGFDLGLDGWIYGANGDSGGMIVSRKTGARVNIQGRDFRFRPDDGQFEPESGQTQFGRHRNDWGDWFGNNNSVWAWQFVFADRELRKNPYLSVMDPRKTLDPVGRLDPISRLRTGYNSPGGELLVTSANSPTPYRDNLFGPAFESSVFVSEPVHNLIRRMVLEPDGPTFQGHRAADESDREFLASSDNWFRPTMLRTGPDGALWIADMYRAVIEHPEWIPAEWQAKLDLRAGHDMGRIYRVVPTDRPARSIPRMDRLDTAGLVAAMDSPNGWQRDTAQRLLMHSGDRAALPPLRKLVTEAHEPKARLQSLWTLRELGGTDEPTLLAALGDRDPRVRGHAIEVGEDLKIQSSRYVMVIVKLAEDDEAQVRFQAAKSLGLHDDPRAIQALAHLLIRDGRDPWFRAAALSAAMPRAPEILSAIFLEVKNEPPPALVTEPLFRMVFARGKIDGRLALLNRVLDMQGREYATWQFAALSSVLDAATQARVTWDELIAGSKNALSEKGDHIVAAARDVAAQEGMDDPRRVAAIRLLGRFPRNAALNRDTLANLLRPRVSLAIQTAALEAMVHSGDSHVPQVVLAEWKGHSPALRSAIIDALLSRPAWTASLVSSLEDQCVNPVEIGPADRRRLLAHPDKTIRDRSAAVFEGTVGARKDVLDRYQAAAELASDPKAGLATFRKVCASCHRLGAEGFEVGPDLTALSDKSPASLLVALLDPNRAFEAKFTSFTIQTTDGRILDGMIASESANGITLRGRDGKEVAVPRAEIEAMASSSQSLMPEGLEKDLSVQDVANVIGYLRSISSPPKSFPGNHPTKVQPRDDGRIRLEASTAEIRGPSLIFEPKYQNLGYWQSENDQATWSFAIDHDARYDIWLEWACDDSSKWQGILLDFECARVDAIVEGTGTWDQYRNRRVGAVDLPMGNRRLSVRSQKPLRGPLLDLRAIELRPVR